ncbi:MAG: flagellar biosynthesis protein FlhA [Pseudomonadales bacterium]|nr:flagellar biosynthesis protein FlhA [Pseudomonadales bacterium]
MELSRHAFGFNKTSALETARGLRHGGLGVPLLLLVVLAMMTLPVPAILLDFLFTFNIAMALVVLLVSVYASRPLDFALFPTILLVATLLRLSLNVASTRVVLLYGHEGGDAAGAVIEAFGEVVVGGNYVVGLVVFLILVIINFVVVTKGAGRISEVSARFTLDAMPGKQMAIDADLNAGMIDQEEAQTRRNDISAEADFYGAMDGASKFVRGDAVAGMLILVVNIIGGLSIGLVQHDLPFSEAVEKYSLLTIGDGLVAQIPSLLLSTASALMVTRSNAVQDVGTQVVKQMFYDPKALAVAAIILFVMGVIPGMPHFIFVGLALVAGLGAYIINHTRNNPVDMPEAQDSLSNSEALPDEPKELGWDDVAPIDMVGLEVGYRLIPLVDKSQNGELLGRIKGVRKKLSQELGFLMPSVHIRDNLELLPSAYRLTLLGVTAGEGTVHQDRELAINPGQVFGPVEGIETKDPAFGLDAIWIEPAQKDHAQTLGYTVVDPGTVIATHLNQVMSNQAAQLLGHEEVQQMLNLLSESCPKLVEELVPAVVSLGGLLTVLQRLLRENVPVRDMRTIAEAMVASTARDQAALLASVRIALSRVIVHNLVEGEAEVPVMTLAPKLEQIIHKSIQQAKQVGGGDTDEMILEPNMATNLHTSLAEVVQRQETTGGPTILLVSPQIRPALYRFTRSALPTLSVLSYQEIPEDKQITIIASVGDA